MTALEATKAAPVSAELPAPVRRDLPLLLVGVDHHTAPVGVRERLHYTGDDGEALLVNLMNRPEIGEALVVSTCNRTEVYVRPQPGMEPYRAVFDLAFAERAPEVEAEGRFYAKRGGEAARHLMSVACGLQSMVLGEPEILGQVKQSAALADAVGSTGPVMRRLVRTAVAAGGRARTETGIGSGAVSLGYASAELARNIFTRIEELTFLILGAGEMAEVVARSLGERGAGRLRVANRSAQHAEEFREKFPSAETMPIEARFEALRTADVVVATTSAQEPLLSRKDFEEAVRHRASRPLLVVDLGVPRNVAADAAKVNNVFLHSIDSLEVLMERNLKRRREEVPRVDAIIEQELQLFRAWYRGLEAEPVVAQLQRRAEEIRRREVESVRERFPAELHAELDKLTRALTRKILHYPSQRLRHAGDGEGLPEIELVRELFHLGDEENP